jgi:hypothetical protein
MAHGLPPGSGPSQLAVSHVGNRVLFELLAIHCRLTLSLSVCNSNLLITPVYNFLFRSSQTPIYGKAKSQR